MRDVFYDRVIKESTSTVWVVSERFRVVHLQNGVDFQGQGVEVDRRWSQVPITGHVVPRAVVTWMS